MKWIDELSHKYYDSCLLIGSGASLDHLPYEDICNSFWINDLIICVNDIWKDEKIKYDYCINHHTVKDLPKGYLEIWQEEIYRHPNKHILPEFDCNDERRGVTQMEGDFYMYKGLPVCESTKVYVKPIVEKYLILYLLVVVFCLMLLDLVYI